MPAGIPVCPQAGGSEQVTRRRIQWSPVWGGALGASPGAGPRGRREGGGRRRRLVERERGAEERGDGRRRTGRRGADGQSSSPSCSAPRPTPTRCWGSTTSPSHQRRHADRQMRCKPEDPHPQGHGKRIVIKLKLTRMQDCARPWRVQWVCQPNADVQGIPARGCKG